MFSAFIGDGYDSSRTINEVERLYPTVKFTARLMTAADVQAFLKKTRTADEVTSAGEVYKEISKRIVSWDLLDQKGNPLESTPANIQGLQPLFFRRLEGIIFGHDPGDAEQREADLKN